jgi:hypothetical protein
MDLWLPSGDQLNWIFVDDDVILLDHPEHIAFSRLINSRDDLDAEP